MDAAYAEAFRGTGYDVDVLGPEAAGAAIRSRPAAVVPALAAALDDWASARRIASSRTGARSKDAETWHRLLAAARIADPDPLRGELRTIWERPDRRAQLAPLRALAARPDVESWPVPTLALLADALSEAGDTAAAAALLRRAGLVAPRRFLAEQETGQNADGFETAAASAR